MHKNNFYPNRWIIIYLFIRLLYFWLLEICKNSIDDVLSCNLQCCTWEAWCQSDPFASIRNMFFSSGSMYYVLIYFRIKKYLLVYFYLCIFWLFLPGTYWAFSIYKFSSFLILGNFFSILFNYCPLSIWPFLIHHFGNLINVMLFPGSILQLSYPAPPRFFYFSF